MSLTNAQVVNAYQALKGLVESDKKNKFVFKSATRCRFSQNLRKLAPIVEDIEKERNELIKKFGVPAECNPESISVPSEKVADFSNEWTELLKADSGVSLLSIKEEELGDNQLDLDMLVTLIDSGVVPEPTE